ncbi:hypothetical protein [Thermococcus barophilus]|uniref:Uncharacterized protein n=1 Tax=Thermococcus barophilus TaxID=55802 RepID=A0A0S1XCH4_THEBA|nr:hypothetical protein [Thermococcus barophilus]ALM75428.1 hypothetical protein TBCH5v1_1512 [Thermococcus barophilus]
MRLWSDLRSSAQHTKKQVRKYEDMNSQGNVLSFTEARYKGGVAFVMLAC